MKRFFYSFILLIVPLASEATAYYMIHSFVVKKGLEEGESFVTFSYGEHSWIENMDDTVWTEDYHAAFAPSEEGMGDVYLSTDNGLYVIEFSSDYGVDRNIRLIDTMSNPEFTFYRDHVLVYQKGSDSVKVLSRFDDPEWVKVNSDELLSQKAYSQNQFSYSDSFNELYVHGGEVFLDFNMPLDTLQGVDSVYNIFNGGSSGLLQMGDSLVFFKYENKSFELFPFENVTDVGYDPALYESTFWFKQDGVFKVYFKESFDYEFSYEGDLLVVMWEQGMGVSLSGEMEFVDYSYKQKVTDIGEGDWAGAASLLVGGNIVDKGEGDSSVYPNPCVNTINVPQSAFFTLWNSAGIQVASSENGQMDVSAFQAGVYFVRHRFGVERVVKY